MIRASLGKAQADLTWRSRQSRPQRQAVRRRADPAGQARPGPGDARQRRGGGGGSCSAQLKVAELPARDAQQIAAEANLAAAQGRCRRGARPTSPTAPITAPVDGRIERVYYRRGRDGSSRRAGRVDAPAEALKVKFYVAEADRQQFAIGEQVRVSCDGCADGLTATISYFASDPQFTPPVIYSRDERKRLSFLTEATLDQRSGVAIRVSR